MATRALRDGALVWSVCRGRDGYTTPEEVQDDMAVEAMNVVFERDCLCKKRNGSTAVSITGTFTAFYSATRFVPAQDDTAAEIHFTDQSSTTKLMRVAAGTAAVALTLKDNISNPPGPYRMDWAALNGKLYAAAQTGVNRLHVYDPALSTTTWRRVGLALPAAATVANTGSGSYEAVIRYYRIRWLTVAGSRIKLMSNAGAVVSFTPSGTGTAARVTRPAAAGEVETHWRVEGSADDAEYYILSGNIAIATTTYDDSTNPANYSDGTAVPEVGAFTPWPSVRFLISTGDRLVGFGAYETSAGDGMPPYNGRVYYSPVLGTSIDGQDDDERVSNTLTNLGWIDMGRDANAEDRALCGPMDGQIFVWQSRGMWRLVGSGIYTAPYRRIPVSKVVGAVSQQSCFVGEDEAGRPCVYFLDPQSGPYRYGQGGLQWCGYDVQDIWSTINLNAVTAVAHGIYDPSSRRCIWWLSVGSDQYPSIAIAFQTRLGVPTPNEGIRKGWSRWSVGSSNIRGSVMLPETIGASMSRKLKPYAFDVSLLKIDDATSTTDNGTNFQAYITSKAFTAGPLNVFKRLGKAYVKAAAAIGVTIRLTLVRNFGDEADRTFDTSIAAAGSETRVMARYDAAALTYANTFQATLGDSAAISNAWTLDKFVATVEVTTEEK